VLQVLVWKHDIVLNSRFTVSPTIIFLCINLYFNIGAVVSARSLGFWTPFTITFKLEPFCWRIETKLHTLYYTKQMTFEERGTVDVCK